MTGAGSASAFAWTQRLLTEVRGQVPWLRIWLNTEKSPTGIEVLETEHGPEMSWLSIYTIFSSCIFL